MILSQNLRMSLNGRLHLRNLLQIIVGGSGSGKSRTEILPNLLLANSPVCMFSADDLDFTFTSLEEVEIIEMEDII